MTFEREIRKKNIIIIEVYNDESKTQVWITNNKGKYTEAVKKTAQK